MKFFTSYLANFQKKSNNNKQKIWIDGAVFLYNFSGEIYSARGILEALEKNFELGIFFPKNKYKNFDFLNISNLKNYDIFVSSFGYKTCLIARFLGFRFGLPDIGSQDLVLIPNHRVFGFLENQICIVHDCMPLTHKKYISLFDRLFFRVSLRRIIKLNLATFCHSIFVKTELHKIGKVPEKLISILPLGLYLESLPPCTQYHNKKKDSNTWKLLFISAYHPRKNIELLIEYIKRIKSLTNLNIQLVLAGSGLSKKLNHLKDDSIKILDYVDESYKQKLFLENDIYVNPSSSEGFGITNLEAQYFKMPILCNNIKIFHEILTDSAIYFNVDEFSSFKDQLLNLIEDTSKKVNSKKRPYNNKHYQNYPMNIKKFFIPKIKYAFEQRSKILKK